MCFHVAPLKIAKGLPSPKTPKPIIAPIKKVIMIKTSTINTFNAKGIGVVLILFSFNVTPLQSITLIRKFALTTFFINIFK